MWTQEWYEITGSGNVLVQTQTSSGNTTYTPPTTLAVGTHQYFVKNIPPSGSPAQPFNSDTVQYIVDQNTTVVSTLTPQAAQVCE